MALLFRNRDNLKKHLQIMLLFFSGIFGYIILQMSRVEISFSKIVFVGLIFLCLIEGIWYALLGNLWFDEKQNADNLSAKGRMLIAGSVLISYAPIYTEGFFFHDDYLNFIGQIGGQNFYEFTFAQGRQATGILTDIMNYITVNSSWQLRVIAVVGVCIYALLLGQIIYNLTKTEIKAVGISIVLVLITPVINVASYGSMFCYPMAFVFSAMGILRVRSAIYTNQFTVKLKHLLFGIVNIVISNFIYQATATVAFSVILICYLLEKDRKNDMIFFR